MAKALKEQVSSQQRLVEMLAARRSRAIEEKKDLMINILKPERKELSASAMKRNNPETMADIDMIKTVPKQFQTLLKGTSLENNK